MIEYNSAILKENEVSTHLKIGEILNCLQYWWLKEVSLKGYVLYNSICIMLSQTQNWDSEQVSDRWRFGGGLYKWSRRDFLVQFNYIILYCNGVYMILHICQNPWNFRGDWILKYADF